eukprot:3870652-Amphidinium_carterae.1
MAILVHSGLCDSDLCPVCHERETVEHVLWHFPRFDAIRCQLPHAVRLQLLDLLVSARLCGICLVGIGAYLEKVWPLIQRTLALMIREYRAMQRVPNDMYADDSHDCGMQSRPDASDVPHGVRLMPCNSGGLSPDACHVDPQLRREPATIPVAPARCFSARRPLQFALHASRTQGSKRWPFSQIQWNRMLRFLCTLRVATRFVSDVPPVSVLELYAAYVLYSGAKLTYFASALLQRLRGPSQSSML